jgi:hypothetical protein
MATLVPSYDTFDEGGSVDDEERREDFDAGAYDAAGNYTGGTSSSARDDAAPAYDPTKYDASGTSAPPTYDHDPAYDYDATGNYGGGYLTPDRGDATAPAPPPPSSGPYRFHPVYNYDAQGNFGRGFDHSAPELRNPLGAVEPPSPALDPGYTLDQGPRPPSQPSPDYFTLPGETTPYNPETGDYFAPADTRWLRPPDPPAERNPTPRSGPHPVDLSQGDMDTYWRRRDPVAWPELVPANPYTGIAWPGEYRRPRRRWTVWPDPDTLIEY